MNAQARISSIWGIALAALGLALGGSTATAQETVSSVCEEDAPRAAPGYPRQHCPPAQSPFRLFGIGDFAGSSMKSADPLIKYWTTNTGFSDSGRELQPYVSPFRVRGTDRAPGSWISQNFEIQFIAAAARACPPPPSILAMTPTLTFSLELRATSWRRSPKSTTMKSAWGSKRSPTL